MRITFFFKKTSLCSAGNPSVQRLRLARRLAAVVLDSDPAAAEEGLHQDVGQRHEGAALRGPAGEFAGGFDAISKTFLECFIKKKSIGKIQNIFT